MYEVQYNMYTVVTIMGRNLSPQNPYVEALKSQSLRM